MVEGWCVLCAVLIRNAAVLASSQIWLAAACAANYEVPQKIVLSLQVCSRRHCWSQTQLTLSFILHKKLTPFRAGSNLACGVKNKFTVFWLEVGLSASQEACVARLWVEKPDQSEGE